MCTIVLMRGVHPSIPLVVAANRDEFYAREASAPRVVAEAPRIVCGLDAERGGTWMGATERGFFVGVTNQRTWFPADKALRSRGDVALRALRAGSIERVEELLEREDAREYNAFNLVFGDARELRVAYARGAEASAIRVEPVPHGVHVLPNDCLDSDQFPKVERSRARATALATAAEAWPDLAHELGLLLADHTTPDPQTVSAPPPGSPMPQEMVVQLHATCIHTPIYGTRSATLLALDQARVLDYRFADGSPCTTPFSRVW